MSRSQLYVPGNSPEQLAQAFAQGADAVIADLVDSVPAEAKEDARATVAQWLRGLPTDVEVWVRINPGPMGHDDVRAIAGPGLRGVCLAKTESTTQLDALDAVLSNVENELGLPVRTVAVAPVLESAGAILTAPAIARAPRVVRLHAGEADLQVELGIDTSEDERELLWARSHMVLASAAAGLAGPVAAVSADLSRHRLRATTVALKRLGFRGRACVQPAQIDILNEVFGVVPAAAPDASPG